MLGALTMLVALFFMAVPTTAAPLTTTKVIADDSTGGDCTAIGTWYWGTKTCTLAIDFTVFPGDGIQVIDNGITIDGAGHTVTGSGSGNGICMLHRSAVTVTGIVATNFNNGILLDSSSNNTLNGNVTDDNNFMGIRLDSSDGNILDGNGTHNNTYMGMRLDGSNDNTVSNNASTGNTDGIYIGASSDNQISGNTTDSNTYNGIYLSSSNTCTISGNAAGGNEDGIELSQSGGNTINGNDASSNSHNGIMLDTSDNNLIEGNTTDDNYSTAIPYMNGIYLPPVFRQHHYGQQLKPEPGEGNLAEHEFEPEYGLCQQYQHERRHRDPYPRIHRQPGVRQQPHLGEFRWYRGREQHEQYCRRQYHHGCGPPWNICIVNVQRQHVLWKHC